MEIITTAAAVTAAKSNVSQNRANASYSKSLMASRALQSNGNSSEVNISQLEKGDVFKGEITNMTGRSVTVSLGNGQTLSAALMDNVPLNIGNQLYFEVKENDGERITIRPLLDEKFNPQNQTIEKSLQSAGLQLNEKNMAVVKELMDASMPIDRNSIIKVLQQLVNHPDADISTVVDLVRCDLPVTDESIEQLQLYQEHSAKLNSQMDSMMNSVTSMYESLASEEGFSDKLIQFNQAIVDTFTKTSLEEPLPQMTLQEAFAMDEAEMNDFYGRLEMMETDHNGMVLSDVNGNAFPKGSIQMDANGMPVLNADGEYVFNDEFVNQLMKDNPDMTRDQILIGLKNGDFSIGKSLQFASEIQESFANQLKQLGMSEEKIRTMLSPKNTAQNVMKEIQDFITTHHSASDDAVKQFLSSKEYTVFVETLAENQWKLTPEQMKNPKEISQMFARLDEQSAKLAMAGQDFAGTGGQQMEQQAKQMQDNLKFMEMLNDKYTFTQIPVQLSNQDVNSELFVYTNKKELAKEKKDISVLLHLDMDHLGSTDVHVQLNGTTVSVRFYLEDNKSVNTVQNHIDELQEKIDKLGLSLSTEVVRRTEKKEEVEDFVDDFLAKDIPSSQKIKRYTFDMRA